MNQRFQETEAEIAVIDVSQFDCEIASQRALDCLPLAIAHCVGRCRLVVDRLVVDVVAVVLDRDRRHRAVASTPVSL